MISAEIAVEEGVVNHGVRTIHRVVFMAEFNDSKYVRAWLGSFHLVSASRRRLEAQKLSARVEKCLILNAFIFLTIHSLSFQIHTSTKVNSNPGYHVNSKLHQMYQLQVCHQYPVYSIDTKPSSFHPRRAKARESSSSTTTIFGIL